MTEYSPWWAYLSAFTVILMDVFSPVGSSIGAVLVLTFVEGLLEVADTYATTFSVYALYTKNDRVVEELASSSIILLLS